MDDRPPNGIRWGEPKEEWGLGGWEKGLLVLFLVFVCVGGVYTMNTDQLSVKAIAAENNVVIDFATDLPNWEIDLHQWNVTLHTESVAGEEHTMLKTEKTQVTSQTPFAVRSISPRKGIVAVNLKMKAAQTGAHGRMDFHSSGGERLGVIYFLANGNISWDSTERTIIQPYEPNVWYEVCLIFNLNAGFVEIHIDGDFRRQLNLENPAEDLGQILLGTYKNSVGIFYYDGIAFSGNIMEEDDTEELDQLWLRYDQIEDEALLKYYDVYTSQIVIGGVSAITDAAKQELQRGLGGLLGAPRSCLEEITEDGAIVIGTQDSPLISAFGWNQELALLGDDGFLIRTATVDEQNVTVIASSTDRGVLYGTFRFLSLIQQQEPIDNLSIMERPRNQLRLLNHWDNWNGTIERGYAGLSLWQLNQPYDEADARLIDYARANASMGINGVVINNVNADVEFIKSQTLLQIATLADLFRAYGIRVYLSVRFDSPILLGGLGTSDPVDEEAVRWWEEKVAEIYSYVPDFGGFLVKGDSEGQPGPLRYGRNHAEGANMLAGTLAPYGGVLIWRAFVYGISGLSEDRVKQAYEVFQPLDGEFADNVILQVKNGPLDFQVREPVSPLIGGMPRSNVGIELQITQEYTGHSTHLCWLAPQWKEIISFDTHAQGTGSTVDLVVDGSLFNQRLSLVAGVANTGSSPNWTGHYLAQANWYAFGRLAWDPGLAAEDIADEWVKMTYGTDGEVVKTIRNMLLDSWGIYESYTAPLGIGLLHDAGPHYDPKPEIRTGFHRADTQAVGFDRTRRGSRFVDQYYPVVASMYNNLDTCPEELLLWFHRVPYTYRLGNGKTVIQHLYDSCYDGVAKVQWLIEGWKSLAGKVEQRRYDAVLQSLYKQQEHAWLWCNTLVWYFCKLSGIGDVHGRTNLVELMDLVNQGKVILQTASIGVEPGDYTQAGRDNLANALRNVEASLSHKEVPSDGLFEIITYLKGALYDFRNSIVAGENSVILHPSHDTYIRGGQHAGINHDLESELQVKFEFGKPSMTRIAFLEFEPDGKPVKQATLRLYAEFVDTLPSRSITVYGVEVDGWEILGLTWDTVPGNRGIQLGSFNVTRSDVWYELDVTEYMLNHPGKVVFRIESTTSHDKAAVFFTSKEALCNNPQLILAH
ncbi:MAG: DNRLRE domain-containing protein [Limnochordia bacterium]|nr:DNRLRE domain-containing protein [Limnochordia bacterium]